MYRPDESYPDWFELGTHGFVDLVRNDDDLEPLPGKFLGHHRSKGPPQQVCPFVGEHHDGKLGRSSAVSPWAAHRNAPPSRTRPASPRIQERARRSSSPPTISVSRPTMLSWSLNR